MNAWRTRKRLGSKLEALVAVQVMVSEMRVVLGATTRTRRRKTTPEGRAAERAQREDVDRRLREMIERYPAFNAEKQRRREAEASYPSPGRTTPAS